MSYKPLHLSFRKLTYMWQPNHPKQQYTTAKSPKIVTYGIQIAQNSTQTAKTYLLPAGSLNFLKTGVKDKKRKEDSYD